MLATHNPEVLKRFSPRQIWGDGNCFYWSVSLALFGTQQFHAYLRAMTAMYIIENRDLYDPHSSRFVLHETCVCSPSIKTVIHDAVTDGSYAELVHIFALSASLSIPIQSYCVPGTHNIPGIHPYTIRVQDNIFTADVTDSNDEVIQFSIFNKR